MVILDRIEELKEMTVKGKTYNLKVLDNENIFNKSYKEIYDFCDEAVEDLKQQEKEQKLDLSQTIRNMGTKRWGTNNECLLYRIYRKKKYSNGKGLLNLVYHNDKIVGLSAAELFAEDAISIAKRLFVLTPHRVQNFTTRFFAPSQNQWFKKNHPSVNLVTASFNLYLKDMIFRTMQKYKDKIVEGDKEWNHWIEWEVYPNIVILNGVPQYLIYLSKDGTIKTHKQLKDRLGLIEVE